ncbi:MAG: hypothetical protein AAGA23_07445 [Pseudomonadota bacterium]
MTRDFGQIALSDFSDRQLLPGSSVSWQAQLAGEAVVLRALAGTSSAALTEPLERLAACSHPAVVRRVSWVAEGESLFLVRPWIEGMPAQLKTAPLEERLPLARRLAEALDALHAEGLGHGRVHPRNLIVDPDLKLKIVDPQLEATVPPLVDLVGLGQLLWTFESDQPVETLSDAARAQILDEAAGERVLPPRLARLILRLLAGRVGTAGEVREELEDIQLSLSRADNQVLAHWRSETIMPVQSGSEPQPAPAPATPAPAPAAEATASPSRLPLFLVSAAAALLLLALLFVVRFLPDRVAEPPPAVVAEPEPDPAPPVAAAVPPPAPVDLEELLRQREATQAILDELINLQLELEEQKVEQWGERAFAAAAERAAEGDEPFREQRFLEAGDIYTEALDQLKSLAALRPLVLAEALERGQFALTSGDAAAAQEAFALALAIEPDNADALAGQARAETLDEVRSLLAEVRVARQAEDLTRARELLNQIVALDPATPGAAEQLAEVEQAIADERFRLAMSEGLGALNRGAWQQAREALGRAARMRPAARAPADALIELERRERDAAVAEGTGLAERSAAEERWEAAIKHYDDLLAADPNLRMAQEGRERAVERLDLDRRLLNLLNDPSQWWSQRGRTEAESLLYDAQGVATPGQRLADQIQRLSAEIERARQPQVVTLVSDNACQVVVYKVARLGQFERRELSLLPGRYTAVGTRDGYRDVRVEFLVSTQGIEAPVNLRCEEQVLARG